jgi:hypothetical protein
MVAGSEAWCISVPESASGHPTLSVQVNFSRYWMDQQGIVSPVRASVTTPANPFLPHAVEDSNFDNNWITIGTLSTGSVYDWTQQPARYVR